MLFLAIAEAEHYKIIVKTRQGGRNKSNLYGLTWWQIHTKQDNPLDRGPTLEPSNAWKETQPDFEVPDWVVAKRKRKTGTVISLHAERAA